MSNNLNMNNKLQAIWNKKGIKILSASVLAIASLGCGFALSNCTSCVGGNESSNYSDDDVNSDNKDNNVSGSNPNNENGATNETNNSDQSIETPESIEIPETFETNDYAKTDIGVTTEADNFEADFTNNQGLTADDIVKLSEEYSEYVNKTAVLSHKYYKYEELTPEKLYSVVYLANITKVSKEETAKLIKKGIISDNINTNIAESFYFFDLYHNDSLNKIMEGRKDIIDLSLILSDEHDIEVANLMSKIITDSVNASYDVNYKNYMDTVFYYAGDVTLYNNQYDYSKSIYNADRSKLSVGADYVLSYSASVINSIAYNKGVSNQYASEMLLNGANDFSNVASVFNGCNVHTEVEISEDKENDKQLTK